MARRKKPSKIPLVFGVAAAVTVSVAVGGYIAVQRNIAKMKAAVEIDEIYDGIYINDKDVSGKTKEEALDMLRSETDTHLEGQKIRLLYEDRSWEFPFSSFGVQYDVEQAVQEAWDIGREGDLRKRYRLVQELPKNPVHIEVKYEYSHEKILQELSTIEDEFRVNAKDSGLIRQNGKFIISDEKNGYELDKNETAKKIATQLDSKIGGDVVAEIQIIQPKLTRADNEKVTDLIGAYTTKYTLNAWARNENLRIGCEKINGTVLAPGEVFSMNVALGPQTYANGYKDAGVYVNGKVEQGVGGGVCQVTSTLYNAVILAELKVVERSPHSMTVGYVPLGQDAAIAGDYKDLKFKNDTDAPIYIEAYTSNGVLVTNIYGKEIHEPGRKIEFEREHNQTIDKPAEKITEDPNLPEGTRKVTSQGKTGCKITVYKKVYQNGKLISREKFSTSTYRATPDEVSVGTKKVDAIPVSNNSDKITEIEEMEAIPIGAE
jgi:vancomycin resistance protein YoaR